MNRTTKISALLTLILGTTLLLLASCSGGGSTTSTETQRQPCPDWDLRTPCGRDAAGNYYKLLQ